jgi:deazaflavin-dependent oxidoreductase (nitroreductase family)
MPGIRLPLRAAKMRAFGLFGRHRSLVVHAPILAQAPSIGGVALPHWLTRVNLAFGNAIMAPIVARLPGFGILEHVGRRSGTVRRTPVSIIRRGPDRYVFTLYYGPDVQWVRNVLAAGGCRVRMRGRWIRLVEPRRFRDPARREIPWFVRPIAALLRVEHFLELRAAPAEVARDRN